MPAGRVMVSGRSSGRCSRGVPSMSQTPATRGGRVVQVVDVLLGARAHPATGQPVDELGVSDLDVQRGRRPVRPCAPAADRAPRPGVGSAGTRRGPHRGRRRAGRSAPPRPASSRGSGTRVPFSTYVRTSAPRVEPSRNEARNRSPVDTCGRPSSWASRICLGALARAGSTDHDEDQWRLRRRPRAGRPRGSPGSLDEPFVVTHHQLGLELLHGLHDHRDHDEQRGAAEAEDAHDAAAEEGRTG